MKVYGEGAFEEAVLSALRKSGWTRLKNGGGYDRALGLIPGELTAFVRQTQPRAWERLTAAYGEDPSAKLVRLVGKEIDARGALDVLRRGIKDRGVKVELAFFRPAHTLAADALSEYLANRLGVVNQLHYSAERPELSVDLALFLNGIPVASAELKNPFTGQTVTHARDQYRARDHRDLFFARRTLVHFAVDPDLVYLTTRLAGKNTRFLPFNQGSAGPGRRGGAGNPPVSDGQYRTSYLWEDVLQRDNFLELLQRYLHIEDPDAKAGKNPSYRPGAAHKQPLIFPRYHQWHAVRYLVASALADGSGENYLVQHSAGSGKSNTIAWLAHQLSSLHDAANRPVFDKVVVLTDRTVLDRQLQDTIYQFEHVAGVVEKIDEDSQQLARALTGSSARIIITTQQKFPYIVGKTEGLSARKYALIIDEAHSSQGGEDNAALKSVLGSRTKDESGDPLTSAALARGRQPNLSVFAFTATPKGKTLELFGRKNPETDQYEPCHVYSMRQAIEEGFILDVLNSYITYQTYFRLANAAVDEAERSLDPRKAKAKLVRAALWSEPSTAQRAKIIVDHFRDHTARRMGGRAKAMVVTPLRADAVRLYQAIQTYVNEHGFTDCGTLVAFSGKLTLEPDGPEYTEAKLNGFSDKELPARFAYTAADDPDAGRNGKEEYRILVVADKYQTGFDQPLLTTMYVAKPLAGIAAVQTLSRLNRTHPLKSQDDLFVMDFVNDAETIKEAFQDYYEMTVAPPTDPNHLYEMQREVMGYRLLVEAEMRAFGEALVAAKEGAADEKALVKEHPKLYRHVQPAVDRFVALQEEEPEKADAFRKALSDYKRAYAWLSQIIGYEDPELELLYEYGRFLLVKLPPRAETGAVDIGEVQISHLRMARGPEHDLQLEPVGEREVRSLLPGGALGGDPEEKTLAEIIEEINDQYGTGLSSQDRILVGQFVMAVAENPELVDVALNNDPETFGRELEKDADKIVVAQMESNEELFLRYFEDEKVNRLFKEVAKQQAYAMIRRPVRKEAERRATAARLAEIRNSQEGSSR